MKRLVVLLNIATLLCSLFVLIAPLVTTITFTDATYFSWMLTILSIISLNITYKLSEEK